MNKKLIICFFLVTSFVLADSDEKKRIMAAGTATSRSDCIPQESITGVSDPYFEGYIQALIDLHFYEYKVIVFVKDREVWLANTPKNDLLAKSIISFIKDIPGVEKVSILNGLPPKSIVQREKYVNRPHISGIWFPQSTELYQPMVACPRNVDYSLGYRGGDKVIGKTSVYVSMGDDFPIYRWLNVWRWHGDLQVGIEAGIWSVFNIRPKPEINKGTELVNTDFYAGIPFTYAVNKWAFRFRIYHVSSHLGDEFLINHPGFYRVNPSFEALDFFTSFQSSYGFRVYFGPGFVLHSCDSYPMKKVYCEYGGEVRFLRRKILYHRLYGNFILGAYFRNWQYLKWQLDGTYIFGYEWSKLQDVGRKIRIVGSFHHGFSLEGQFSKQKTSYGTIGFNYGF